MANGFIRPSGVTIDGDTFAPRYLFYLDQYGTYGSRTNATKAGCLYVFNSHINDTEYDKVSCSGGHTIVSSRILSDNGFEGTFLEVWAADTDGRISISGGGYCQLWELYPKD